MVILGMILLAGNPSEVPLDRAVDNAWTRLVPQLLDGGLPPQDQAFVASLAWHSVGHGNSDVRAEILEKVRGHLENAVEAGAPAAYLGAVCALLVQDATEDGDVVPRLVEQLARCIEGSVPLDFAGPLLTPVPGELWPAVDLRRARVLLCARAFDDGLELRELLDVAGASAALGSLFDVKGADALAHLRLLRTLEPTRPWDRLGAGNDPEDESNPNQIDVATVFEIAKDPHASARVLSRLPDALLVVHTVPRLYVCARGFLFDNVWILEPPEVLEIVARTLFEEGGYHLVIGQYRFWFADDPAPLAQLLEKWFRFFFKEFRGQLVGVYRARAPVAARRLVARNGVECPDCRRLVLPVPGEVGVAADIPRREAPETARAV